MTATIVEPELGTLVARRALVARGCCFEWVIAVGREGVVVRGLDPVVSPFEAAFLALIEQQEVGR